MNGGENLFSLFLNEKELRQGKIKKDQNGLTNAYNSSKLM